MLCEHYKEELREAAAAGAEPQVEVRAHLETCASCRTSFAEEQSLFSAIDTVLHSSANTQVPASFLQRVRARMAQEAPTRQRWASSSFALACAAAVVLAFLLVQSIRRITVTQKPQDAAMKATPSLPEIPARQGHDSVPTLAVRSNSLPTSAGHNARNHTPQEILASRDANPKVLVLRDQEVLLAAYAEQLRHRRPAVLVAASPDETILAPLQVAPIQIAQLDVKLLAEEQSQ